MEEKRVISVGDILVMKKPHACRLGDSKLSVLKLGSDIRVKCEGCGHEMFVPRVKLEKNIKQILRGENN